MSTRTLSVSGDPTATARLRSGWVSDFNGRWRDVRGMVRDELTGANSLLSRGSSDRASNVAQFRRFLHRRINDTVVESVAPSQVQMGQHWTAARIRDAYRTGLRLANRSLRAADFPDETIAEATNDLAAAHRDARREQFLITYHDIEDAVQATLSDAGRAFRNGLQDGLSKRDLVSAVNDRIDAVGQTRTQLIANTRTVETVNAAALTAYERAGVEAVELDIEAQPAVEERTNIVDFHAVDYDHDAYVERLNAAGEIQFVTAGDDRVCPECMTYAGVTFTISAVTDGSAPNPPLHPNCRCFFLATPMDGDSEAVT